MVVVNSYYQAYPGMKVAAKVFDLAMGQRFSQEATLDVGADSSTRTFVLPEIEGLSSTWFVSLSLADANGNAVSKNFYWLSTRPETLDWDKSTWRGADQARMSFTTSPEMPVSRTSRPWNFTARRLWSTPSKRSIVAWKSWTLTGFSSAA